MNRYSSRCLILPGVDTALLREAWQRAFHADERSSEALLEAWAATLTTSERLQVAVKERYNNSTFSLTGIIV